MCCNRVAIVYLTRSVGTHPGTQRIECDRKVDNDASEE